MSVARKRNVIKRRLPSSLTRNTKTPHSPFKVVFYRYSPVTTLIIIPHSLFRFCRKICSCTPAFKTQKGVHSNDKNHLYKVELLKDTETRRNDNKLNNEWNESIIMLFPKTNVFKATTVYESTPWHSSCKVRCCKALKDTLARQAQHHRRRRHHSFMLIKLTHTHTSAKVNFRWIKIKIH